MDLFVSNAMAQQQKTSSTRLPAVEPELQNQQMHRAGIISRRDKEQKNNWHCEPLRLFRRPLRTSQDLSEPLIPTPVAALTGNKNISQHLEHLDVLNRGSRFAVIRNATGSPAISNRTIRIARQKNRSNRC